jgi:hypothetical protein
MGILKNGMLGNYSGKMGNLVFYIRNGKQVVRTIGKITKPATTAQLQNRKEMAVTMAFLKPLTEFINAGFGLAAAKTTKSAYNLAVSYQKMNAISGTYPDTVIAYEKVRVTQGMMFAALDPAVELTPTGLSFTWSCPAGLNWPRPYDQVMLLACFPAQEKVIYLLAGASRAQCADTLTIPAELINEYMEVYLSFVAQDRRSIGNSTYMGNFNLT